MFFGVAFAGWIGYPFLLEFFKRMRNQYIGNLRLRSGKDFQAFRVETDEGLVGWVISGKEIKVMSYG